MYRDRHDAGRQLAARVSELTAGDHVLVLALPRGGVPVGFEVAQKLGASLDVFLVRKLGVPGHEELAMGAIASGGVRVLNREVIEDLQIPAPVIDAAEDRERAELERRDRLYRGSRPPPDVRGRVVLLVDDGLATGATMEAAVAALRQQGPARVIVAVPVAAASTCEAFRRSGIETLCAFTPEPFQAVGLWYEDFSPTTDAEVRDLLTRAEKRMLAPSRRGADDEGQRSPLS